MAAVGQLTAYTDATTAATPLAIMKGVISGAPGMSLSDLPSSFSLLIGNNGGCLGEVSALALRWDWPICCGRRLLHGTSRIHFGYGIRFLRHHVLG